MKLIRGTNVYPRAVEAIVREFPEVEEFQIVLTREEGIRDEITVQVELATDQQSAWAGMNARLAAELADAHEGLRFNLALAEPGSLPRFELKAKRLQDLRDQGPAQSGAGEER